MALAGAIKAIKRGFVPNESYLKNLIIDTGEDSYRQAPTLLVYLCCLKFFNLLKFVINGNFGFNNVSNVVRNYDTTVLNLLIRSGYSDFVK